VGIKIAKAMVEMKNWIIVSEGHEEFYA